MSSLSISKIVREITGRNWLVYSLVNHPRLEIYFGCTKDFLDRCEDHANYETEAIKHWNFENDRIDRSIIQTGLTQEEASKLAHQLEKQVHAGFEGYKTIGTSGI